VLDIDLAMRVVTAAALLSVPWSLAALLRAVGKDERFALLAFPLAYNAHFLLGFLNFVVAIGLAFYGLALAVEVRDDGGSDLTPGSIARRGCRRRLFPQRRSADG
jgi:hypothetical protein